MENVENIIIEHLRAIRSDIGTIKDDAKELKTRMAHMEVSQAQLMQSMAHLASGIAQQQVSFDRLTDRVERVEKRLELAH